MIHLSFATFLTDSLAIISFSHITIIFHTTKLCALYIKYKIIHLYKFCLVEIWILPVERAYGSRVIQTQSYGCFITSDLTMRNSRLRKRIDEAYCIFCCDLTVPSLLSGSMFILQSAVPRQFVLQVSKLIADVRNRVSQSNVTNSDTCLNIVSRHRLFIPL